MQELLNFCDMPGTYVLMQLFTAIIIENFSSTTRSSIIPKQQLDDFVDAWVEIDAGRLEEKKGAVLCSAIDASMKCSSGSRAE